MPSVPRYDSAQVDPRPLGGGRRTSVAGGVDPEARAQSQLGSALMTGGVAASVILKDMQNREDADVVFRAETAVKDEYLKFEQEAREQRQGRFAKDLTTDTAKWWEDQAKKSSEGMKTEQQRKVFGERLTKLRQQSLGTMSHYESLQLERSHDEGWLASKNSTISVTAASPTNEAVDGARLELQRANRYQAARRGWEPERLKAETMKDTTSLHKQVIESLSQRDPMSAKAYFEKHKGEIDGTLHAELGKFAEKSTATAVGDATAEDIWKAHGPTSDRDAVSLDVLETKVREKLKGNEEAMKLAISGVKERSAAFAAGRKERDEATEAAVWKAYNGGATLAQIRRQNEFLQLSPEKQTRIAEHIEGQVHLKRSRTLQEENQAETARTRAGFAAYSIYSRPDNLEGMTENQILALTPSLGNQLVGHLIENKRGLGNKIIEARIDQQDFDHVAQGAGLAPFDPKKSEADKAALGELKFRIEQRIDAEQSKAKRPLTRAEKMQVFQQEIDNKVLVDEWGRDPVKPLILLKNDELKNAYVLVDGQRVNVASIPREDREEILKGLEKRRVPANEQIVAQIWHRAKHKKAPKAIATTDPKYVAP